MKITKEEFEAYVTALKSNSLELLKLPAVVTIASGKLTKEKCAFIETNFDRLRGYFSSTDKDYED